MVVHLCSDSYVTCVSRHYMPVLFLPLLLVPLSIFLEALGISGLSFPGTMWELCGDFCCLNAAVLFAYKGRASCSYMHVYILDKFSLHVRRYCKFKVRKRWVQVRLIPTRMHSLVFDTTFN